jgi:hypothetical protein
MKKIMVGQVNIAPETVAGLRSDEVPVFAWVRIAVCCAGAAEVSLHAVPLACHRLGSDVPPPSDPPGRAYAHRSAYPHLAARRTLVGVRGRCARRFTPDLPDDFGLRSIFGQADDVSDHASPLLTRTGGTR